MRLISIYDLIFDGESFFDLLDELVRWNGSVDFWPFGFELGNYKLLILTYCVSSELDGQD